MGVVRAKKASITSSTGNSLIKEQKRLQNSRLLQCFRAIGLIIDDLPFVWYGMGKESFITASLGKSFVVYKCDKLTPVLVSPQLPKKILALEVYAKKQLTFTANGRNILVWKRVEQVNQFTGHHKGNIKQLLSVGNILFSLDEARHLCVWDMNTMEFLSELNFPAGFTPSFMMHPSTYLNKILIGSEEGTLELWNIRSMKCIYSFKGWGSAVTSIHQSPAVDVVGIGLADGKVYMHNLQYDKSLMDFHQEGSKVTAISFRTDSAAPEPFAVTGSTSGDIAVWNLKSKRLENMIVGAHEGMVVSLFFLPNEPILVSSGVDNSLKMWIFDNLNGTARLLKSREGHKAPPTRIRYYGNNTLASMTDGSDGTCCQILSAGQDRAFRVFHTAREQQSTEMSQGPVLKKAKKMNIRVEDLKLPPITQFAAMETRERDWSNVVTCHENEMAAYVWRFERRAIGKKILRQFDPSDKVAPGTEEDIRRKNSQATSVGISTCGSFAVVGSIGGAIFKYNMQSGEARGSYPTAATPKAPLIRSLTLPGSQPTIVQDMSGPDAHQGPVSGVVVDALNRQVISGGIDGILKFWDFTKHQLLAQVDVGSPICQLEIHRDSNLICVSSDDQILRIYDITTRKLVRRFQGHTHRITDVVFSNDARWLFSSSADASLRIWDLPTGKCIDWLKFHKPVTGLAISPTGEFLATTHVGNVGIFLWSNRHFFTDVFLDTEPKEPILMDMPVVLNEMENQGTEINPLVTNVSAADVVDAHAKTHKPEIEDEKDETGQVKSLDDSLITLSTAPRGLWHTLFNLELIKKRNKPIEPPKAPEKAPFFLATARKDDVHPVFVPMNQENGNNNKKQKEEQDQKMDGWGVDEKDETWGDDEGESNEEEVKEEEEEEEVATSSSKPLAPGSRILKSTGFVTTRSKLAILLCECAASSSPCEPENLGSSSRFGSVSVYLQTLSASSVDVELSALCMGDFDEEGIQLLHFL